MAKIFYTSQVYKRTFVGTSTKDAYLRACKWYATNVISKDNLHSIQVEYIKDKGGNAITIILYASLPEEEIMDQHCACCKEMHSNFFINEDTHCDRCSAISFHKRLERKMMVKIAYCKEILRKYL